MRDGIIAQWGRGVIRRMKETEEDFQLFLKWMTDPQTMKYWEGMTEQYTYERVAREYRQNAQRQIEQCIIEYDARAVGFCQFCVLSAGYYEAPQAQYDKFIKESDLVYGIDIFLGETEYRSRGIGTECLKALMKALFEKRNADALMIDPKIHNARAIRCYHKCGFRDWFIAPHRELQDGIYHDSLIMGVKREDFI